MSVYSLLCISGFYVLFFNFLHFRMARPCKFCGAFFQDPKELELHENRHRDLDYLNENVSDIIFPLTLLSNLFQFILPNIKWLSVNIY